MPPQPNLLPQGRREKAGYALNTQVGSYNPQTSGFSTIPTRLISTLQDSNSLHMTTSPATTDDQLFLLIDGHAIVFRAWFAMRDHLITASGQNTTGASGFMSMFLRVVREQKPTHIAVTFDTKAPTFRKEMFPA